MNVWRLILTGLFLSGILNWIAPLQADEKMHGSAYLAGKLLVATPNLEDPNFSKTVILMVEHDAKGAFGLIINRLYGTGPLRDLVKGFGLENVRVDDEITLRFGGPVERGRAFVLHSGDYAEPGTVQVNAELAITNQTKVLEDMAKGDGPNRRMVILGYAGWGAGQLDGEVKRGDWTSANADADLIFLDDIDSIWTRARKRAGVPL